MQKQVKTTNLVISESREIQLIDYILTNNINESSTPQEILTKLKAVARKGLLTAAIVMSVLPSLNAAEQKEAIQTAHEAGIEMKVNSVEEEFNLVCFRVICETPSEVGFKEAQEQNRQKAVKAVAHKCAEMGEDTAKLIKLYNISTAQTSYAKSDGNGTTIGKSSVCSVIEVWVAVHGDYGNNTITIRG